jgi:hypothetical protein
VNRPTYKVRAYRSGKWWALETEGVPRAVSQARRLDHADEMIRDALSAVLDVPEDSFDVTIEPDLEDVNADIERLAELRHRQELLANEARKAQHEVVAQLVNDVGLPYRDVGTIVGLSYQRVAQILAEG